MISKDEALKIVLNSAKTLLREKVTLLEGFNRVLGEDICASESLPPFANSAMDGYALRSVDTRFASPEKPTILRVIEDLPAGYLPKRKIKPGEAIKIMTGAVLPKGADAVVKVEDTRLVSGSAGGERVEVLQKAEKRENVRKIGEDVSKGEKILKKGKLIQAPEIALLAALGKKEVEVFRTPRVGILTTGDELVGLERKLSPGKIRDSNSYMLYTQVLASGAKPVGYGIIPDREDILKRKFCQALKETDLVVTSAGVSVGEYDLVKKCLLDLGLKLKFHTVAIRPGKPLLFGTIGEKLVFGLPGNPVSAMVTFEIFVHPAILRLRGMNDYSLPWGEAILAERIVKKKSLHYYLRGTLKSVNGEFFVRSTGPQGSGIISSLVKADCLVSLPEEKEVVNKGEKVKIIFFAGREVSS